MDEYNNNYNGNQGAGFDSNANAEQNYAPQEPQINQADVYAPYNQPQAEDVQESVAQQNGYNQSSNGFNQPWQNTNQQGFDFNAQQQNNQYPAYNQPQDYNQSNPYTNQQQYNPNTQYGAYNQPQQYNDAYYNQQYPTYNFQEKPKGFAIASMVLGIGSFLISCCIGFITFFSSVAGLILGIVSLKRNEDGKGMAIAGIILSSIGILLSILSIVIWVSAILDGSSDVNPYSYYDYNYYY